MHRITIAQLDDITLEINKALGTPVTYADQHGQTNTGHIFIERNRNGYAVMRISNNRGATSNGSAWGGPSLFGIPAKLTKNQLYSHLEVVLATILFTRGQK